jgi:chromosome segregation and condensation protein ScpB
MKPPNSRERQMMQRLRGVSWVKAFEVADSPKILANLIERGWVENQRTDGGKMYRLTDLGLEAMKAPIGLKAKK